MGKILVTGSQGNLGKELVPRLLAMGHDVWGCDLAHSGESRYIRADIRLVQDARHVFQRVSPDYVFNLAAEFGRRNGSDYYQQMWETNCVGLRHIIEGCRWKQSKLIHASSSEVYGAVRYAVLDACPMRETDITATFHNEYALTKWTNEKQLEIAGIPAVALRIFNVYGREAYHPYRSVICQFIHKMLHNQRVVVHQNMWRDFLYIDDWVDTVASIPERNLSLLPPVINIGGIEGCSIEELATTLKRMTGSSSEIFYLPAEQDNVRVKKPDLALANTYLGHAPKVSLEDGLKATVEWMRRVCVHAIPERAGVVVPEQAQ